MADNFELFEYRNNSTQLRHHTDQIYCPSKVIGQVKDIMLLCKIAILSSALIRSWQFLSQLNSWRKSWKANDAAWHAHFDYCGLYTNWSVLPLNKKRVGIPRCTVDRRVRIMRGWVKEILHARGDPSHYRVLVHNAYRFSSVPLTFQVQYSTPSLIFVNFQLVVSWICLFIT